MFLEPNCKNWEKGEEWEEGEKANTWVWVFARSLENAYSERREAAETQMESFWEDFLSKNKLPPFPSAFISGSKMVSKTQYLSSHPACHHFPHTPNPDCGGEDNLSLAENAKAVHFPRLFEKQQLKPSQTPWKLMNSFPFRLIALWRQWTHLVNIHWNIYSLFAHIYLSYLSLFRLLQSSC